MITINEIARRADHAFAGLSRRQVDLSRYARTIEQVYCTNVAEDPDYQRTFNGLYGVRRNVDWRQKFYRIFVQQKSVPAPEFRDIVQQIFECTGRVEASFASKLIATLDPKKAVYDAIVRSNLDLPTRASAGHARIEAAVSDYEAIQAHLDALVHSEVFPTLRQRFNNELPEFTSFTDLKVLDLMIWQLR